MSKLARIKLWIWGATGYAYALGTPGLSFFTWVRLFLFIATCLLLFIDLFIHFFMILFISVIYLSKYSVYGYFLRLILSIRVSIVFTKELHALWPVCPCILTSIEPLEWRRVFLFEFWMQNSNQGINISYTYLRQANSFHNILFKNEVIWIDYIICLTDSIIFRLGCISSQ